MQHPHQAHVEPFPDTSSSAPDPSFHHPAPPSDIPPQKKKKRRVALSCAECAKRKQKCNRETPCQHCLARRVTHLCVPYTRSGSPPSRTKDSRAMTASGSGEPSLVVKTSPQAQRSQPPEDKRERSPSTVNGTAPALVRPPSTMPTMNKRVSKLEMMVNAITNVIPLEGSAFREWRQSFPAPTSPPPAHRFRPDTSSTTSDSSRPTQGIVERDDMEGDIMGEGREGDESWVAGLDRGSSMRNPLPQSLNRSSQPVSLGLDQHGSPAEQLQKLFADCGVSPDRVLDLMRDLPPKDFGERLVAWFFEKVNYVRYPIAEALFRDSFEDVYASPTDVSPSCVIALPLVFIVLAIAIRVAPEEWAGGDNAKRTHSLKMYWSSKTAIIIASAVKAENVQLVETRILTGLYLVLMHERRLAEGWAEFRSGITTGQAIGLHRDGTKLGLDTYSVEYRRRLWSYLCHADATYSCLLGRPASIDASCVDTLPPLNIDLQDLAADPKARALPMDHPTFATYLILRKGLADIVFKIVHHFQRLQGQTQYKDVEILDAELKTFVKNLPPQFQMLTPDTSYDQAQWYLPVHRYYIQTEILHFTIILHRPWLLRKLRSNRYSLSRAACFEAAVTDYKIRLAFKKDCPDFFETLLGGSFREFNAAMIAGISIIIDPASGKTYSLGVLADSSM
ncbi:hypothetical protein P7C73_g5751, partial [Tremellales sp. Uapishka_1]